MAVWSGQRPGPGGLVRLEGHLPQLPALLHSVATPPTPGLRTDGAAHAAGVRQDPTPTLPLTSWRWGVHFSGLSPVSCEKDSALPLPNPTSTRGPCGGQMKKGKSFVSLGRLPGRGGSAWRGGHGAAGSSASALGQSLGREVAPSSTARHILATFLEATTLQELNFGLLVLAGGGRGGGGAEGGTQSCPGLCSSSHLQSGSVPTLPLHRPAHQGLLSGNRSAPTLQHFLPSLGS